MKPKKRTMIIAGSCVAGVLVAATSLIGGILGITVSFIVTPIAEYLGVRVEISVTAFMIALIFAVGTGTIFGFYPAYKASKLVPVEALGAE